MHFVIRTKFCSLKNFESSIIIIQLSQLSEAVSAMPEFLHLSIAQVAPTSGSLFQESAAVSLVCTPSLCSSKLQLYLANCPSEIISSDAHLIHLAQFIDGVHVIRVWILHGVHVHWLQLCIVSAQLACSWVSRSGRVAQMGRQFLRVGLNMCVLKIHVMNKRAATTCFSELCELSALL